MPKTKFTPHKKKKSINPHQNVKSSWELYLEKIYFDPSHPGSFKGVNKLHKAIKDEGKYTIPLNKVKRWLQNQESFSLHKPLCRAFPHLKVIVGGLNDQYKVDLAGMQKLKDKNDGVQFLLIIIDVFSRFMWVEPLENKLEESVINAFQHIFQRAKKPRCLRTDKGGEFTRRKIQDYFNSINVEHWTAHNDEMKANFAERVIQMLKQSLWGYIRARKIIDTLTY